MKTQKQIFRQTDACSDGARNDCRDVTCYVSTAATASRLSILFLVLWLMPLFTQAVNLNWNSGVPLTVADGDNVTISGIPGGTLNVPAGVTITIDGTVNGAATGISIDIAAGATVLWSATYSGNVNYLITLPGNGAFEVVTGGLIENTGAGAHSAIYATGNGIVTVSGGTVRKNGSSYAIDNIGTINIEGGTVEGGFSSAEEF